MTTPRTITLNVENYPLEISQDLITKLESCIAGNFDLVEFWQTESEQMVERMTNPQSQYLSTPRRQVWWEVVGIARNVRTQSSDAIYAVSDGAPYRTRTDANHAIRIGILESDEILSDCPIDQTAVEVRIIPVEYDLESDGWWRCDAESSDFAGSVWDYIQVYCPEQSHHFTAHGGGETREDVQQVWESTPVNSEVGAMALNLIQNAIAIERVSYASTKGSTILACL